MEPEQKTHTYLKLALCSAFILGSFLGDKKGMGSHVYATPSNSQAVLEVTSSRLNVRAAPGISHGSEVVCSVDQGTRLKAVDFELEGGRVWCKVEVLDSNPNSCQNKGHLWIAGWLAKEVPAAPPVANTTASKETCCRDRGGSLEKLGQQMEDISSTVEARAISLSPPIRLSPCDPENPSQSPCNCRGVSSEYGMRIHPVDDEPKLHRGVDIAAPKNTPIYATADGVVTLSNFVGGYGHRIVIDHFDQNRAQQAQLQFDTSGKPAGVVDSQIVKLQLCGLESAKEVTNLQTAYSHLDRFAPGIEVGTIVKKGQLIGYVNNSGTSTGDHLDYQVVADGLDCSKYRNNRGTCDPRMFTEFPPLTSPFTLTYFCDDKESK